MPRALSSIIFEVREMKRFEDVELVPIISVIKNPASFDSLIEYPWQTLFEKLSKEYSSDLLAITKDGRQIGAMYLSYKQEVPELVFFEIEQQYRGEGLGRASLITLFHDLKEKGFDRISIQTGRPEIYTRMGFKFEVVEKRGIIVYFDEYDANILHSNAPMTIIFTNEYLLHNYPEHPESTNRLSNTIRLLRESRLIKRINIIPPREATMEELQAVHTKEHIERIRRASENGEWLSSNTPAVKGTYRSAILSFGGAMLAAELIEKYRRIFVLSRPPGHHAEADVAKGFCYFNNMAGLAMKLFKMGYRPMVIDWDIHHGDGTQKLLYDKPIMFVSIHQKDLYPYTGEPSEIGAGEGMGFNVNIQVPPLVEDEEYMKSFERIIEIADEYKPDIVLVSAGQDGLREEKLSGTLLTTECYHHMARMVRDIADKWADGRIILLLEGGYALDKVAEANLKIINGICYRELEDSIHKRSISI